MRLRSETSADDWTSSPEVDGATWELGPDPEDAQWLAEQNETWDADDEPPDSYWDQRAGESAAQDRLDVGLLF